MLSNAAILLCALALGSIVLVPSTASAISPNILVSTGDSLSTGIQPVGPYFQATLGYTGRVAQALHLQHVSLGCPGATSSSFIWGDLRCPLQTTPPEKPQLETAEELLKSGDVKLLTIDIGFNDFAGCMSPSVGFDFNCMVSVSKNMRKNVATIAKRLRKAGPTVPMVGLNYYNVGAALWLKHDENSRLLAKTSAQMVRQYLNNPLAEEYRRYGFKVADVFRKFKADQFTEEVQLRPYGMVPTAVAWICWLTWACDTQTPDVHVRDWGYFVMSREVLRVYRRIAASKSSTRAH